MTSLLIIIPAYNEEENIRSLIDSIRSISFKIKIEIIVINDCSTDRTSSICKELGIKVIDLPCNLGIGGAVQTGYKYAKENNFDLAIQVDGDGQHDPVYIDKIVEPILEGKADMVIGSRYIDKSGFQSTRLRRFGIRYLCLLINTLTDLKITDPTSGFRVCNKRIIDQFAINYPKDYPEPESIMYLRRKGFTIKEEAVVMNERVGGTSSINLNRSIYYMIKVSLAIFFDKIRKESF
ncbi:glycosyltransferase family 2 protein [Lysinibacillus telephonicus]|uniref:Glycosyltransferase family 2 protein n=1 Tax=Lysinibacillus telephonicus TaxID=1714840 RepID=A0A3S0I1P3_9BACI|nr:glycosyltransferase family 2 protein [Lysinibacillus telephonicus]RTQ93155.1 glycosyltransferase family 2 protein [Lysinibacillus telephonicus]